MIEYTRTSEKYKVGLIVEDDQTKQIFEVMSCEPYNGSYRVGLKEVRTKHLEYLKNLEDALQGLKLHDKDMFMLENIIAQLRDSLK